MKPNRMHRQGDVPSLSRKVLPQVDQLQVAMLSQFQEQIGAPKHLLHLALNEAAALAWQTSYPQLFFASLAAEKADSIAKWNTHQQSLQRMSECPALAA